MDIKGLLYIAPPRITARIIAFVLALLLALAGAKILDSIFDDSTDVGGANPQGGSQTSTELEGDSTETEQAEHFKTEGAVSVGTVINAKNAVLFCLEDAAIIAGKEMQSEIPIKEATAFAVALTVMKAVNEGRISLADEAVCPASAASSAGYPLSAQVLPIGRKMKVQDILKCMLYQSGTSYAYTLAVHTSGSADAFVAEMNALASTLGLVSASFENCTGDGSGGSISAYDFAVIMKHFLGDTYLKEMFCSNEMISVSHGAGYGIELVVKNSFFESFCTESQAKNDGILGGKISRSGYLDFGCVVFNKDGKSYVSVIFESEAPFSDALMLYSAYALCV